MIVKIFSVYLKTINRLGWNKQKSDEYFSRFLNQRLVHVLVICITISLLFINLTTKTRAGSLTDSAHNTILSELIKSEFGDFEEDEQLIVETFNREAIISSVQQSYLDNLSSFRPQPRVTMNNVDDEEEMLEGEVATIHSGAAVVNPDIARTTISKKQREETITYTVKPGDTVSAMAVEFEVSVSTILWENNLSAYSMIRPGDKLKIPPVSGVTHKVASGENLNGIAKKYEIEPAKVAEFNKLASIDEKLQIGQELFIPGGKKVSYPTYQPSNYTGFSAIADFVKSPNVQPVASNKMNWPTEGSRISQYYSWRHYAIDIANKLGTPIYAADAGTIEYAGWGTGYGNQIVIDHGGGKKTRYAHLSKFYAEKGDSVTKGQTIAAMGSTGWSTGSHLHFEVIIDGKKYNPLNYIK